MIRGFLSLFLLCHPDRKERKKLVRSSTYVSQHGIYVMIITRLLHNYKLPVRRQTCTWNCEWVCVYPQVTEMEKGSPVPVFVTVCGFLFVSIDQFYGHWYCSINLGWFSNQWIIGSQGRVYSTRYLNATRLSSLRAVHLVTLGVINWDIFLIFRRHTLLPV